MTSHTVELTEKQMAATCLAVTSYFAIAIYNNLIDPIAKQPVDLDMLASLAEVVDLFNNAVGNEPGELPELIKQIKQLSAEQKAKLEARR